MVLVVLAKEDNVTAASKLFESVKISSQELKNRIIMAPMIRSRASVVGVPSDLAVTYYGQRADVGLIITKALNLAQTDRETFERLSLHDAD